MAQITELRHEDKSRRRTNTLGAVGAMLVVAAIGVGWLVTQGGEESNSSPAVPLSTPSGPATTSDINLKPGRTVGAGLQLPLVAKAPDSWSVWKDGAFVWLDADGTRSTITHIQISGPVVQVFDSEQQSGVPIPSGGYANWLRENPTLDVVDDRMVVVDGQRFPQVTVTMADDAPGKQFRLGRTAGKIIIREDWPDYNRDEVVTETVIEVEGKTMVVSAVGTPFDSAGADVLDEGLALVLSTMKLPN